MESQPVMSPWVNIIRALLRPFLAVLFSTGMVTLTLMGMLPPEIVGTAATTIAAFYFGERSGLKQPGGGNGV